MEKEDLQLTLNRLKKDKQDVERVLTEQLQAKELELLQLRSEIETSQVMKSLTADTSEYWHVERHSSELKIQNLQEQLERLQLENNTLNKLYRDTQNASENCIVHDDQSHNTLTDSRSLAVVQSYQDILSEVCHLHSAVRSQSELMRRLKERPLLPAFRRVQCLDDVERVRDSTPRPPSAPPLASQDLIESTPLRMSSLDDSSWSFPSPPRPSEALFWSPGAD